MSGSARLRPVRNSDAAAVLDAFRGTGMERQGVVVDDLSAQAWVDNAQRRDRYVFAIDVDDTMVGAVGVTGLDPANRTGWFWYWMHEAHRGQGLTARAAATVATWALTEAGLERLELGHRANNASSGAVARAAGFIHEGTERAKFLIDGDRIDVFTYGRLHTDPVPATRPLPQLTDQSPAGPSR